jgi:hypothetical protein
MSDIQRTTIDGLGRVPDAGYQRTDAELAHQKQYEAREASRSTSVVQIHYRIDEILSARYAGGKQERAFVICRAIGDEKEARSMTYWRKVEVKEALREAMKRDKQAAERLGVGVHVTTVTR